VDIQPQPECLQAWLTFIASLIGSLAWPTLLGIILFRLWRHVDSLVSRIEEVTLPGGAGAKFAKQLNAARSKSEKVALEEQPPLPPAALGEPGDRHYLELAKSFPAAAVMEAFKDVEKVLLEIRSRLGYEPDGKTLTGLVNALQKRKLITPDTAALFNALRQSRNTAVHAGNRRQITAAEAIDYNEQVQVLVTALRRVLDKL
jgi:hypothetical protein